MEGETKLAAKALVTLTPDELNLCVVDYFNEAGEWNVDLLNEALPSDVILKIWAVIPPSVDNGVDRILWSDTNEEKFSIRSAYQLL